MRNSHKILVGKFGRKMSLRRRRRRKKDKTETDLNEMECRLDSSCSVWGLGAASFEHGNALSGCINSRGVLSDYHVLKKESALWRYFTSTHTHKTHTLYLCIWIPNTQPSCDNSNGAQNYIQRYFFTLPISAIFSTFELRS
jgi:hypothetical protein